MKYRKKRFLLLKQKHIKIIIIILSALALLWALIAIVSATTRESKKQQAVQAVLLEGAIHIGLRGDLGALCTYNEQEGRFEGFEKDLADQIISRLFEDGIIVNYVLVNSRTKDAMLRHGEIDLALAASIEKEINEICYTSSYYSDPSAFLVAEERIAKIQELSGGTVAIVQGSLQADASETEKDETVMDDYLKILDIDADIKLYASYPEAVAALREGFADAVCASELMLKIFGTKGMVILPERFMPNDYHVGVRASLGEFCEAVDDIIVDMRRDGSLEALISKWNLTNYEQLDV